MKWPWVSRTSLDLHVAHYEEMNQRSAKLVDKCIKHNSEFVDQMEKLVRENERLRRRMNMEITDEMVERGREYLWAKYRDEWSKDNVKALLDAALNPPPEPDTTQRSPPYSATKQEWLGIPKGRT